MTRSHKIPSYRLRKPTGQGVVRLNGKDHYLGRYNTDASRQAYNRIIGEWLATGQHRTPAPVVHTPPANDLTVDQLILAFNNHAQKHYRGPRWATDRRGG